MNLLIEFALRSISIWNVISIDDKYRRLLWATPAKWNEYEKLNWFILTEARLHIKW